MSDNSQVIFQSLIYLATHYMKNAVSNANTALLDAQQAMSLLEIILTEGSSNQIERQKLLTVEAAYVDLELFIERLQIVLDILNLELVEYEMNKFHL